MSPFLLLGVAGLILYVVGVISGLMGAAFFVKAFMDDMKRNGTHPLLNKWVAKWRLFR